MDRPQMIEVLCLQQPKWRQRSATDDEQSGAPFDSQLTAATTLVAEDTTSTYAQKQ